MYIMNQEINSTELNFVKPEFFLIITKGLRQNKSDSFLGNKFIFSPYNMHYEIILLLPTYFYNNVLKLYYAKADNFLIITVGLQQN